MPGDALLGRTLGRYAIEATIGSGGFATVYRAVDTVLERPVALKVLDPSAHRSPTVARRFVNEGKSVARLDHPAIVPVYDAGETDALLWMAMRLVDGPTLDAALSQRRRFDRAEVGAIVDRIAGALDHAHAQGIVHRDVKPSNILLEGGDAGRAWLADFGIAATARTAGRYTTGTLGTAAYMAPEQARPSVVGPPADIYSLGCVVYLLLAGRTPFPGEDHVGLLMAHATEPVPPIGEDALDQVLGRALAKSAGDRPPSAGALADELRPVLAGSASPDGYGGDAETAMGATAVHKAAVAEIEHEPTLAYGTTFPAPAAAPPGPIPPPPPPPDPAIAGHPGTAAVARAGGPTDAPAADPAAWPAGPGSPPPPDPALPGAPAAQPAAGGGHGYADHHAIGGQPPAAGGAAWPAEGVRAYGGQAAGGDAQAGGGQPSAAGGAAWPGEGVQAGGGQVHGGRPVGGAPGYGHGGVTPPRDPTAVGEARRGARRRLYAGLAVLAAGVAAGVVALIANGGGSGGNRQCDRAGICFELPDGWALGEARAGEGTIERDGEAVAIYLHQPQRGINDIVNTTLGRSRGCQVDPTEATIGGAEGARCENPEGEDPQLIVAALANGRAWRVIFQPGLPDDEVESVVDGIEFTGAG